MGADRIDFKALPDVSESLRKKAKKKTQAAGLLAELEVIEERVWVDTERAKAIKTELELIQRESDLRGLRSGDLCFVAREMEGRKTLDKYLLIENGVSATVIEKSMKPGAPYVERRFKNLKKKDDVKEADAA